MQVDVVPVEILYVPSLVIEPNLAGVEVADGDEVIVTLSGRIRAPRGDEGFDPRLDVERFAIVKKASGA